MEGSSNSSVYRKTIDTVENIYGGITELFGEDSMEDGLFSIRSNTLHQFSVLASAFHQLNTLDFLDNSSQMKDIFSKELRTANYRTRDYENRAIKQITKNLKKLETYLEKIVELSDEIVKALEDAEEFTEIVNNAYFHNVINSLNFYLEEIKSRILKPAGDILYDEISGSRKLLKTIESKYNKKEDISMEEIARMCEVMAWGLESPPGWNSIQNDSNELTGNLEKKIGSLKAINTFY